MNTHFGIGNFSPSSHKANAGYMFLGATGLLLLAGLWIPVRYLPHIDPSWQFAIVVVAIIFFMILNVFARLAMTSLMLFEVSGTSPSFLSADAPIPLPPPVT